ncbi:hypothetical protein [Pelagibacterium lentulum]|nr:hypothetical protein [Pelagibacterium lentulum]
MPDSLRPVGTGPRHAHHPFFSLFKDSAMSIQDILNYPKPVPDATAGAIVARMMKLIAWQIAALEEKIKKDGLMSESELRQLETMTKTMDRLIALDKANAAKDNQPTQISPELAHVRDRLLAKVRALETE